MNAGFLEQVTAAVSKGAAASWDDAPEPSPVAVAAEKRKQIRQARDDAKRDGKIDGLLDEIGWARVIATVEQYWLWLVNVEIAETLSIPLFAGDFGGSQTIISAHHESGDFSYLQQTAKAMGDKECEAQDRYVYILHLGNSDYGTRGEVTMAPETEAGMLGTLGYCRVIEEPEALRLIETRKNGTEVPSVGDRVRVAHLLSGLEG